MLKSLTGGRARLTNTRARQPISEHADWQIRAACRSMPVSMFYPPLGMRGYSLRHLERQAKLVCGRCPVISQCLRHALDTDERYGVWGGSTAQERSLLTRVTPGEQRSQR
ncbi:WhiB family transcriptional regulator [Rhodococcus sp. KRD162]|uniref:WhiB family transcriptional regulator n=1 Tax=Rhodococcus sp. KRD162 TaxID=2729725 RepID=UPI0027DCEF33|nr:WhiB family transcriptional regulator [Rhodococcus sp. KRD162]